MRIAVTGASGMLGRKLGDALRADGHTVVPVVRPGSRSAGGEHVTWDPEGGTIDAAGLEGLDAVVHLAGEGIAEKRWSEDQKRRILESRAKGTTLLATTLAGLDRRPKILLSASGVDYYGETGDREISEGAAAGDTFLADVCVAWEGAAAPAADAGIRTTFLRTAMVLDPRGGALAKMLPLFKLGAGGRMGSGEQWWSWISATDWVRAVQFLLEHDLRGPVNLSSPEPVTNAEFTKALGTVVHRPTLVPVPSFGPRLLVGRELADTLLFTNHRVLPAFLLQAGFRFEHRDITTALRAMLVRD